MSAIRSKNTRPELTVRKMVRALGCHFSLYPKKVPGRPDLALAKARKAIFVHGCFWHQHKGCKLARIPKRNLTYWLPKFARNRARDARDAASLRALGWQHLVIWECEVLPRKLDALERRISRFLKRARRKKKGQASGPSSIRLRKKRVHVK